MEAHRQMPRAELAGGEADVPRFASKGSFKGDIDIDIDIDMDIERYHNMDLS